ncbi:MAG: immune inhibitor A, partial [Thermoplasmata archaeon]|nr:immune inhibitor A [Thermoplasmata archaeon]
VIVLIAFLVSALPIVSEKKDAEETRETSPGNSEEISKSLSSMKGWFTGDKWPFTSTREISVNTRGARGDFFFDDMESGVNNWTTDNIPEGWGLGMPTGGPGDAYSGDNCWATSLQGNYPDLSNASISLERSVDLKGPQEPVLSFYHWLEIEGFDRDIACVEARSEHQSSWTTLWWNPDPDQPDEPFRTNGWENELLSLDEFAGNVTFIRFRLMTDDQTNFTGWYLDDVSITYSSLRDKDAAILSIDTPAEEMIISQGSSLSIQATVENSGILEMVIPVNCTVEGIGENQESYDLGIMNTSTLDPGDQEQVSFQWEVPDEPGQYMIKMSTELEDDDFPGNDEMERSIWIDGDYDLSIVSLKTNFIVQGVGMSRRLTAKVENAGEADLADNVKITFNAYFVYPNSGDEYQTDEQTA